MTRICHCLLFLFAALFYCCAWAGAEDLEVETLSPKEAQKLISDENKNLVILDVRTPREYAEGHIPRSQNVDFFGPAFERDINRLDRESPVLLYCQTGRRSEAAAEMLIKADFKKVYDLKGGLKAWKKASLPITEKAPE